MAGRRRPPRMEFRAPIGAVRTVLTSGPESPIVLCGDDAAGGEV